MVKRLLKWCYISTFGSSTPVRLAFAASLGFFLSALPMYGDRLVLIIVLAVLFRLNLIALLMGMAISFAIYQVPLFSSLMGNIMVGILLSLGAMPIFSLFFGWGFSKQQDLREGKSFIFHDNSGKRWLLIRRIGLAFAILVGIALFEFVVSLDTNPMIPNLGLRQSHQFKTLSPIAGKLSEYYLASLLKAEERIHPTFQLDFRKHQRIRTFRRIKQQEVYGFLVNWDENSTVSLEQNIHRLGVVIPEWYHLQSNLTMTSEVRRDVIAIAKNSNVRVVPLINNYTNGKWDHTAVHRLLNSPAAQNKLISQLLKEIKINKLSGVNIDFEGVREDDRGALNLFMGRVYAAFHPNKLLVTMDIPADDQAFDCGALAKVSDRLIVMLYDEHEAYSAPGPIASKEWVQQSLDLLNIPPQKLIVALANYGYDWTENSSDPADVLTFGDITQMVNDSKLRIQWDDKSGTPYIRYKDGEDQHLVWFLDAVTLYNQLNIARENGSRGVAIWRLGSEDPSIWHILSDLNNLPKHVNRLHRLISPEPTDYSGEGEVLRIVSSAEPGRRDFHLDRNGLIDSEEYTVMPKPFEIQRFGKPTGKEVALTFDDGPDSTFTPQILNILSRFRVKGTFFIVGENAEKNPELVQQIYREGHEIGSHTFTHPNVADISPARTRMELNANQRLIEELTGHSVTMFRPPYVADAEPSTPNELLPILRAQEMGYTMVGELIDPEDWQRPPAQEIIRRVLHQLPNGNVILLHDAGGDRSATVKALPKIIELLRARGYTFVTVSDLIGKSRDDLMPPVPPRDIHLLDWDRVVFTGISDWESMIAAVFYLAIGLGIFRFVFLIILASRQRRKYRPCLERGRTGPFVSVVIAAYNEEQVIAKTINSILQSDYNAFEIIVVDDGSTDGTSAAVAAAFGDNAQVRLISKENGGKSSAVNRGFREARGEAVVALDADTLIADNAISLLVRHFNDPKVAAVSGNVKVGNVHNLLTTWQHVEYVTGFNLERRAFDELNCITVVPGAIGAWRKSAVQAAGYYQEDTLAEDTDLTLNLLRKGHRIAYEERAFAYTESPQDLRSLLKQRFRWSYGTLQCLWKHRSALFDWEHKALGFVALPNMWIFQYVFQSISPLADIFFVLGLLGPEPGKTLAFYCAFLVVDLLASLFAFRLDGEPPRPLVWLFLQRLLYRQIMTYVVIKSLLSALKGVTVGWNKLQRAGNVEGPKNL